MILFTIIIIFLSTAVFIVSSLVGIVLKSWLARDEFVSIDKNQAIVITGCDTGWEMVDQMNANDRTDRLKKIHLDITSSKNLDLLRASIDCMLKNGIISQIWALINNSGVMVYGEFDWLTEEQIESQVHVNVLGTIKTTKVILPYIIKSKGRVINVSSINDTVYLPGTSLYTATKSAITSFSKALGFEIRKFGCHVVVIRPGDFARLTNIMSKHAAHKDAMWSEMSQTKRDMYKQYFPAFNKHVLDNYGMTSPLSMDQSSLFTDFERALLSKNPSSTITVAPFHYRTAYFILGILPTWVQYYLLDVFVELTFRWSFTSQPPISSSSDKKEQ